MAGMHLFSTMQSVIPIMATVWAFVGAVTGQRSTRSALGIAPGDVPGVMLTWHTAR